MSKDKYPSIFSSQMEAIVFSILQIFYATRTVLKIGDYPRIFPSFSWGIFAHVTCLDQSRERKYLMDYKSHYTMLYKYDKRLCQFLGRFYFHFSLVFYNFEAFLIKQLFHSRLLDMR